MQKDLICFCHLRWNFVYQRPQHLMQRVAKYCRVFFIEEPVYDAPSRYNEVYQDAATGVWIVIPHLPAGSSPDPSAQRALLDLLIQSMKIKDMILWYYSPMALSFSGHLRPFIIIYDCMDELSAFKFAPPELKQWENILMEKADIVFTGGHKLYEAKQHSHSNIHPFPSSIDKKHFEIARRTLQDTPDQAPIRRPRIGYYGVIDERFDFDLLTEVARIQPRWNFILVGPVVKIDKSALPVLENIHFLGQKDYKQLPFYLAGWDVAMMPFALNESTEFISPTKTPEYLSGGKPVISTPIRDVVKPYGELGLVEIADTPAAFADGIERLLQKKDKSRWLAKVDEYLANISWDKTWKEMATIINKTVKKKGVSHETAGI
jgi:glycosyltransferase involved in cell wall biosynthesis